MKKVILLVSLSLFLLACSNVNNEVINESITREREDYTHLFGISNNKCTVKNLKEISVINIVVEEWVDGILKKELYNGVSEISELEQVTFYYNFTSDRLIFSGDLSIFHDLKIDYEMSDFNKFKSSDSDLFWSIDEGMFVAGYFNTTQINNELAEVKDYIGESQNGITIKIILSETLTVK